MLSGKWQKSSASIIWTFRERIWKDYLQAFSSWILSRLFWESNRQLDHCEFEEFQLNDSRECDAVALPTSELSGTVLTWASWAWCSRFRWFRIEIVEWAIVAWTLPSIACSLQACTRPLTMKSKYSSPAISKDIFPEKSNLWCHRSWAAPSFDLRNVV